MPMAMPHGRMMTSITNNPHHGCSRLNQRHSLSQREIATTVTRSTSGRIGPLIRMPMPNAAQPSSTSFIVGGAVAWRALK